MQHGRPKKPSDLTIAIGASLLLHLLLFVLIPMSGTNSRDRQESGRMLVAALEFGSADDARASIGDDLGVDSPTEDNVEAPGPVQEPSSKDLEPPIETQADEQKEVTTPATEDARYADLEEQPADLAEKANPSENSENPAEAVGHDSSSGQGSTERDAGSREATSNAAEQPRIGNADEGRAPRVALPRPANEIRPEYPLSARRRGLEGVVVIRVTISPAGEPLETTIVSPSEHEQLNQAAVSAVRAARFFPGTVNDEPAKMSLSVRIVFEVS